MTYLARPRRLWQALVAVLRQALAIKDEAGSPLTTQNEVMRRRAQWLLEKIDDLF